jgi:hypothetical protein
MSQLPVPADTLTKWIQTWVKYDAYLEENNKKLSEIRKQRDEIEGNIVNSLKGTSYESMIMQTGIGRLQIVEEKHLLPLTVGRLEELLHNYYRTRHPVGLDETNVIMKFIKENKGYTSTKKLRKVKWTGGTSGNKK